MNYLAHLSLSGRNPALMIGNFIADDIPLKEEKELPDDISDGIRLHRRIDQYTDRHQSFLRGVERLRTHHRKYAPVVLDILNDHMLSRNWSLFFESSEHEFHNYVYEQLSIQVARLAGKARRHVQTLLDARYLKVYQSKEGLTSVLRRMDKRTKFPSHFEQATEHLYANYDFYDRLFVDLYRDLLILVEQRMNLDTTHLQ